MAEREGFEPPIPVKVCPLSRRIVSTTHAPLRVLRQFKLVPGNPRRVLAHSLRSGSGFRLRARAALTPARPTTRTSPHQNSESWLFDSQESQLAAAPEKSFHNRSAAPSQHASANVHAMIELRVVQYVHHRVNRARLRIVRAVNQTLHAR